jgi:hypothetical protein
MTTAALPGAEAPASQHFTWQQAWTSAVLHPSVATYQALVADPAATRRRAFIWAIATMLISQFISGLAKALGAAAAGFELVGDPNASGWINMPLGALVCAPLAAILAPLFLLILAAIPNWIATRRGGQGTLDSLIYAIAAFTAPIAIVSTLVGLPFSFALGAQPAPAMGPAWIASSLLGLVWAGVGVYLGIVAVQAVHGTTRREAIVAMLPALLFLLLSLASNAFSLNLQ